MGKVSESIFSNEHLVIPMADVQFIHKHNRNGFAINIVFKGAPIGEDGWHHGMANLSGAEAESFLQCWCRYRHELEYETLMNLTPDEVIPGTLDALHKLGA